MFPSRRTAGSLGLAALLTSTAVSASRPDAALSAHTPAGKTTHVPGLGLAVDVDELRLAAALPGEAAGIDERTTVELPLGEDGEDIRFQVRSSASLSAALRAEFPQLGAYVGQSVDDPHRRIRLERSPLGGFTAALYEGTQLNRVLAHDADGKSGHRAYAVYTLDGDREHEVDFVCDLPASEEKGALEARSASARGDCELRRYRLAVATTGAYAEAVGGDEPELAAVLAQVNVAVNRVNEIYERDLGITFELVAESAELIFLDPATDPFRAATSNIALARRNHEVVDSLIGAASYDIGHLFHAPTTGASGSALRNVVCNDLTKAVAMSGAADPRNERFYVDYFAHELGHQFGANHTANNDCGGQRNAGTAYEPGSGSTIMGYAGVCAPNVQSSSDDYFHAVSIGEVASALAGPGGDCAVLVPRDNTAPAVEAGAGPYTIPVGTPFTLTAAGTDAEDDALTYVWEQFDLGGEDPVPPSDTNAVGPLFRSLAPTPSPSRQFPAGLTPGSAYPDFEVLPSVARELTFRVTVRDNNPAVGCTDHDDLRLLVTDEAGPFRVTAFPSRDTLMAGRQVSVDWDVAGTSTAPVGVELVDILLRDVTGVAGPVVALAATPNDGSAVVTVPEVVTDSARWEVRARGNVFFAVSSADLRIDPPVEPGFTLEADTTAVATCGSAAAYQLDVESVGGFTAPIRLSVVGLPDGAEASIGAPSGTGSFSSALALSLADSLAAGTYGFRVVAEGGDLTRSLDLTLQRQAVPTIAPSVIEPTDGGDVAGAVTAITWAGQTGDSAVRVEVATSPTFPAATTVVRRVDGERLELSGLPGGVYYVRLAYDNDCGRGPWSPLRSFRQLALERVAFESTSPSPIGDRGPNVATSSINVTRAGTVYDLQVGAEIAHSYVGDLAADLELPAGEALRLFDNVNEGDCDGYDFAVAFADTAAQTVGSTLGICGQGVPSISGTFRPVDSFGSLLPREAAGTYTLRVTDNAANDGGSIESWEVALWYAERPDDSLTVFADTLAVLPGRTRVLSAEVLRASRPGAGPSELSYAVKRLPELGAFRLRGQPLRAGDSFTQAAVDAGELSFAHASGEPRGTGTLVIDVVGPGGAYQPNARLPVKVAPSTLAATLTIARPVSCHGAADAVLVVEASGGATPYRYRFDSGAFGSSDRRSGIDVGRYRATVRDALGTEVTTAEVQITQPDDLVLQADVEGDVVSAVASGGVAPLRFRLGDGPLQPDGTFTDVPDGDYEVEVVDANDCVESTRVVVATAPAIRLVVDVFDEIDCAGETGVIRAIAAGGTPPYGFSLDGGPSQTSGLFEDVAGGEHVVVVIDAAAERSEVAFTLNEPTALVLEVTVSGRDVSLAASGGTPPYRYRIGAGSYGEDASFEELAAGRYEVAVRDRAGCEQIGEAVVAAPPPPPVLTSVETLTAVSCAGAADARVVAAARSGVPPYTFELADGTRAGAGGVFGGLPAGRYSAVAIDSIGARSAPLAFEVAEPAPLTLAVEVSGARVSLAAAGGTPPYAYRVADAPAEASADFGPFAPGSYRFSVRDANGCTASASARIDDAGLNVSVARTLAQESCPGAEDGAVTLSGIGGVPPYSYSLDGRSFQRVDFFGGLAPGSYTAYVRDARGETAQGPFEIGARAPIAFAATVTGSLVQVDGAPTGARPSYSFDGGATFGPDSAGFIYTPGQGEVIVRLEGCRTRVPVMVEAPLTLLTAPAARCGDAAAARLAICAEGGVGDYTLESDAGEVRALPTAECPGAYEVVVPAGRTTVTVTLSDSTGAALRREVAIAEAAAFELSVEIDDEALTARVEGGVAPYTYQLNDGEPQASPEFEAAGLGDSVVVTVRDSVGCTVSRSFSTSGLFAEAREQLTLAFFPNPTSGLVRVELPTEVEVASLAIFDVAGRRVAATAERDLRRLGPQTLELDLGELPTGTYHLRLRHSEGLAAGVLVKR